MNFRNIWLAAQNFGAKPTTKVQINKIPQKTTDKEGVVLRLPIPKSRSRGKLPNNDNSAQTRVNQIKVLKPKTNKPIFEAQNEIPGMLKAIRWLNLGDEKINEAILYIRNRRLIPEWAVLFSI